jgi:negative regulator of sigma E activity
MSEQKLESLSAFMDGELDGDPATVIDSLMREEALRRKWTRYHLIADVMHQSLPERLDSRFAARVAATLRTEPTVLSPVRRRLPAYLKPAAGLAIAASVAAMAVITVQRLDHGARPGMNATPAMTADASSTPGMTADASSTTGAAAAEKVVEIQPIKPRIPEMRQYTFPVRQVSSDGTRRAAPTLVNSRLQNYLLNYNAYHAQAGMQGMPPYVRLVAHDNQ